MYTRPCASPSPPDGGFTATNAPKDCVDTTVPFNHSVWLISLKSERSARGAPAPLRPRGRAFLRTIERVSLSPVTSATQTLTPSPGLTTSSTLSVRPSASFEMGTKPSVSAPTSTKAPNFIHFVTTPWSSSPTFSVLTSTSAGLNMNSSSSSSSAPPRAARTCRDRTLGTPTEAPSGASRDVSACFLQNATKESLWSVTIPKLAAKVSTTSALPRDPVRERCGAIPTEWSAGPDVHEAPGACSCPKQDCRAKTA
mmetsp:Transcript_108964/g.307091  ORF Transcript_108964/g.307091 Transcript_108964/m.307091 type:complete len:254 (+) Transcript_108964:878-1639(+)